jgi:hypothetical protein
MVQADISQLSAECNSWRETLRNYRDQFTASKNRLQEVASHSLSKEELTDVEHYQNQFHIQLINIHDLKQSIKNHDRKVSTEVAVRQGQVTDETLADHENLHDEYVQLEHTLQDLRTEFDGFLQRSH